MISWFRRKELDSTEYLNVLKRVAIVEARLDALELNQDNMRNLARKIQKHRAEAEESKDLNIPDPVILPV